MAKNKAVKPPKSRPAATSALSQPLQASSSDANITAFAPDASLFAQLSQAVDRCRLRVYTASPAGLMADYLLPEGMACHAIAWVPLSAAAPAEQVAPKKRKAQAKAPARSDAGAALHVALGLSDGTVLLYAPHQAKVVRVLVAASPDSASSGVKSLSYNAAQRQLWTATANGWVHQWDVTQLHGTANERIPPMTHFLPDSKTPTSQVASDASQLLAAHHAITLYDTTSRPTEELRFSGHATPITHLAWATEVAFVSAAAEDRHVYLWHTQEESGAGQARAMLTLDAPARRVHTFNGSDAAYVLAVSESGAAAVYRLPVDARPKKGLATVQAVASVHTSFEKSELIDAIVYGGRVRFARAVKGVKIVLEDAPLYDASGALLETISLQATSQRAAAEAEHGTQRYKETNGGAGVRAELPGHAASAAALVGTGLLPEASERLADDHDRLMADGELVDEPTLAQRLKALKVQRGEKSALGDEESESPEEPVVPVGGASLASSLTQALHSGDHALLTSCLVHSEPNLIRTTVRRISGPLAVRLLEACVERLNRGGVKSKGALGSSRARGIVEWMYQAMTCHTAYLMSLPDLVARLSQLHHSLAARLASHQRLLALKGRLELVMSQIDMNMAYTADEAPIQVQGQKLGKRSQPAELERRQEAQRTQQRGQTWVEPEDEEEIEEIGLDAHDSDDEMAVDEELDETEDVPMGADLDEDQDEDDDEDDEDDLEDEGAYDLDDSDAEPSDDEDDGSADESLESASEDDME
ncbi:Small subunit (SSU) processome component [Malassezia japonica]|uniref:Small subunit (SSU) processome component n=1 Tax=Malassezia japonica TaxID=223818 RepID=A0AAF0F107_9BASI|nr:Small subunit (SSU) processome component [Malassezia japonica]WFD37841.1 Small subunit (SSU) processome component [Malassezia japonica]